MMKGYASRTGTKVAIAGLSAADWGWIVGPLDMGGPILGGMSHACDNGAWPAHIAGRSIDIPAFLAMLNKHGPTADFIVVPDIVGGGMASLALTQEWLPILLAREDLQQPHLLIAVQDGMSPQDVAPLLSKRVGIFVGESTEWKLETMPIWGALARTTGCYLHIGRVNTQRRIALCAAAGANSFDGTSVTRFSKTLRPLDLARRQMDMEDWMERNTT